MIYTYNWIEPLQKNFRQVMRMRGVIPNYGLVFLFMGKAVVDKKSCLK